MLVKNKFKFLVFILITQFLILLKYIIFLKNFLTSENLSSGIVIYQIFQKYLIVQMDIGLIGAFYVISNDIKCINSTLLGNNFIDCQDRSDEGT